MPTSHRSGELIAAIYEAALDPGQWDSVLRGLEAALGVFGLFLVCEDKVRAELGVVHSYGFDDKLLQDYADTWFERDPGRPLLMSQPVGKAVATNFFIPQSQWLKTEYFNEFAHQHKIGCQLGIRVADDHLRAVWVGSSREVTCAPFEQAQADVLDLVAPHIKRSLQIGARLDALHEERSLLATTLDAAGMAVMLLDEEGRVAFANGRAEALLKKPGALRLRGGRLSLHEPAGADRLARLIGGVTATALGQGLEAGGRLIVDDAPVGQRLVLHAFPFGLRRKSLEFGQARLCAIVFVFREDETPVPPADLLCRLYGFTPAEARLARHLADTGSLETAAEVFSISRATARTQLQRIFSKTGTRRQADLMRLLLTSPGA